jgi:hypothetical protein
VRCRMYIFELRRCPPFKALSHTWGSQMQPQFCFESRPYPTVYLPSDISSNLWVTTELYEVQKVELPRWRVFIGLSLLGNSLDCC